MIARALDRVISAIAPAWGLNRMAARATMAQMEAFTGSPGGYDAGQLNRLTRGRTGTTPVTENAIPIGQLQRLRWQSWQLYRNNAYARKIVRNLEAKVIGQGDGLHPQSLATRADGTPFTQFRERAEALWKLQGARIDFRGRPGQGGLAMLDFQKLGLRSAILSGDCLYRLVPVSKKQQRAMGLPAPLLVQIVDSGRLAADHTPTMADGHKYYRGIELDPDGRRAQYWITDEHPADSIYGSGETGAPWKGAATWMTSSPVPAGNVRPVPVAEMGHVYVQEDVDQLKGIPWFSAALLELRDTGDYKYNELKAAALGACVVAGYSSPTGKKKFGLGVGEGGDLTDADGNPITQLQPGMFINLGQNGKLEGFNPQRPSTNAEAFIQFLLRGVGAAVPGVKSSTITGDYRNSSFSSERSADNDIWPELEGLQDWFSAPFCQPIYEALIDAALVDGWFDGVISAQEYAARRDELVAVHWQGPVARSINPVDDVEASRGRIAGGTSSPQMECAKNAVNLRQVMRDVAEFYREALAQKLPAAWVNGVLGMKVVETVTADTGDPADPVAAKKDGPDSESATNPKSGSAAEKAEKAAGKKKTTTTAA